jgi:hypothetical protein
MSLLSGFHFTANHAAAWRGGAPIAIASRNQTKEKKSSLGFSVYLGQSRAGSVWLIKPSRLAANFDKKKQKKISKNQGIVVGL